MEREDLQVRSRRKVYDKEGSRFSISFSLDTYPRYHVKVEEHI
jgi:hypothetical protein